MTGLSQSGNGKLWLGPFPNLPLVFALPRLLGDALRVVVRPSNRGCVVQSGYPRAVLQLRTLDDKADHYGRMHFLLSSARCPRMEKSVSASMAACASGQSDGKSDSMSRVMPAWWNMPEILNMDDHKPLHRWRDDFRRAPEHPSDQVCPLLRRGRKVGTTSHSKGQRAVYLLEMLCYVEGVCNSNTPFRCTSRATLAPLRPFMA